MDQIYSLTLLAAMIAVGVSIAGLLTSRMAAGARRFSRGAAAASLGLALVSGCVHLAGGHRPGTPEAMAPLELAREHPALLVVGALAAFALVVSRPR